MPEKPKPKGEVEEKEPEDTEKSSWGEDQKERGYYYDDTHGYDVFEPDEEKEDD